MLTVASFIEHFKTSYNPGGDKKILLAVSGGADSICMLHLFIQSFPSHRLAVAHCNFRLRGEESDADEDFVAAFCKDHNIALHIQRFDTAGYVKAHKTSIQVAARALRYSWFESLAAELGASFIATAHHYDDHIETILINLRRSKGIRAFTGIPGTNGNIIRPLLPFTKEDIEQYLNVSGIAYRTDSSNLSEKYLRNRIRLKILPALKTAIPGLLNKLEELHTLGAEMLGMIRDEAQRIILNADHSVSGTISIDTRPWITAPGAEHILYELLRTFGFNYVQANEMHKPVTGERRFMSSTHTVLISRGLLTIRDLHMPDTHTGEVHITSLPAKTTIGAYTYTLELLDQPPEHFEAGSLYLDLRKLDPEKIVLRRWQKGDRIIPLGMRTHKKISDLLTDKKINTEYKQQTVVMLVNETIAAAIPYTISNDMRLDNSSAAVLKISRTQKKGDHK